MYILIKRLKNDVESMVIFVDITSNHSTFYVQKTIQNNSFTSIFSFPNRQRCSSDEKSTIDCTNDVEVKFLVICFCTRYIVFTCAMRCDVIHHILSRTVICIWQIIISVKTRFNVVFKYIAVWRRKVWPHKKIEFFSWVLSMCIGRGRSSIMLMMTIRLWISRDSSLSTKTFV